MNTSAYFVVFAAIIVPAVLYFRLALIESRHVNSLASFFPLTRHIQADTYSRSTVSSGLSLATVILALVNLAPFVGLGLLVAIASYAAGFWVLYIAAPYVLSQNPTNETLQSFLGTAYSSKYVKRVALFFTFVGYVSIFAMELLVGVSILNPFLGDWSIAFAVLYLLFLVAYSIIAGFKAVVATEQWHFKFIIVAILMLPVTVLFLAYGTVDPVPWSKIMQNVFSNWSASSSFIVGIIVMNVPAAISDAGTWHRLCAVKNADAAQSGLKSAIKLFVLLWGSLILFSCILSSLAIYTGGFIPSETTLMDFIVSQLADSGGIGLLILGMLMLGLFAAMITTADSLLHEERQGNRLLTHLYANL